MPIRSAAKPRSSCSRRRRALKGRRTNEESTAKGVAVPQRRDEPTACGVPCSRIVPRRGPRRKLQAICQPTGGGGPPKDHQGDGSDATTAASPCRSSSRRSNTGVQQRCLRVAQADFDTDHTATLPYGFFFSFFFLADTEVPVTRPGCPATVDLTNAGGHQTRRDGRTRTSRTPATNVHVPQAFCNCSDGTAFTLARVRRVAARRSGHLQNRFWTARKVRSATSSSRGRERALGWRARRWTTTRGPCRAGWRRPEETSYTCAERTTGSRSMRQCRPRCKPYLKKRPTRRLADQTTVRAACARRAWSHDTERRAIAAVPTSIRRRKRGTNPGFGRYDADRQGIILGIAAKTTACPRHRAGGLASRCGGDTSRFNCVAEALHAAERPRPVGDFRVLSSTGRRKMPRSRSTQTIGAPYLPHARRGAGRPVLPERLDVTMTTLVNSVANAPGQAMTSRQGWRPSEIHPTSLRQWAVPEATRGSTSRSRSRGRAPWRIASTGRVGGLTPGRGWASRGAMSLRTGASAVEKGSVGGDVVRPRGRGEIAKQPWRLMR